MSWRALGWSESREKVTRPEVILDVVQKKEKETSEKATYTAQQLNDMPWRDLKRVYEDELSLGDYPGKDDAISRILTEQEG